MLVIYWYITVVVAITTISKIKSLYIHMYIYTNSNMCFMYHISVDQWGNHCIPSTSIPIHSDPGRLGMILNMTSFIVLRCSRKNATAVRLVRGTFSRALKLLWVSFYIINSGWEHVQLYYVYFDSRFRCTPLEELLIARIKEKETIQWAGT